MSAYFDDGKEDGALRTIGELSKALGVKTHVLRYWEKQFPMLEPLKRSGGRRYYREQDVELIVAIDRLVNQEGYTLKGAQKAISMGKTGRNSAEHLSVNIHEQPDDIGTGTGIGGKGTIPPLELTTPIAGDGGEGAGALYSDAPLESALEPLTLTVECVDYEMSRAEIVLRLKEIRRGLAAALAA